jgi:hypothetical protein
MKIEYELECGKCEINWTKLLERDKLEKFLKTAKCPLCDKKKDVYQVFSFNFSVMQDPKTIGHLADRNTQKMSSEEIEQKTIESKNAYKKDKSKYLERLEESGQAQSQQKEDNKEPWFGKLKDNEQKKLEQNPTKDKVEKFIHTGEV